MYCFLLYCILTHFNNCNFSKAQLVYSLMMVFYTETCMTFLMSILIQYNTLQYNTMYFNSFNNCNFSKAQIVCSLVMVICTETCSNFLVSIYYCFKLIQLCISWWGKKIFDMKNLITTTVVRKISLKLRNLR
jgi:hypothetical protein